MEWKDLAPWIAIAITLILSILVPLFTQIANNSHQRKMQREKFEYEQKQKKIKAKKGKSKNLSEMLIEKAADTALQAVSDAWHMYLEAKFK